MVALEPCSRRLSFITFLAEFAKENNAARTKASHELGCAPQNLS